MDYPVPSFGPDPDMVGTARAIEIGEAAHSHKLIMGTAESQAKWHYVAKDTHYNFAPDLDEEVAATAKHLTDTQSRLGHTWVIEDEAAYQPNYAQLRVDNADEEPVSIMLQIGSDNNDACSSDMCFHSLWYQKQLEGEGSDNIVQYPHPPLDEDVTRTLAHETEASEEVGHVWDPYAWMNQ